MANAVPVVATFAHFAPEAEIRFAPEKSFPAHSHKVQSALTRMKSCEIPDYSHAVKAYWTVMVLAALLGFVWVLDRVLFLPAQRLELSSILTFSRVGLLSLLVLTFTAATYWTCQFYLQRLNAKTREAEQMGRLHLATSGGFKLTPLGWANCLVCRAMRFPRSRRVHYCMM